MKNSVLYPLLATGIMLLGLCFLKIHHLESFVGIDKEIVPLEEVKIRFDRGRLDAKMKRPPAETEYFYQKGYGFGVQYDL